MLEARLTEGASPPRLVAADWGSATAASPWQRPRLRARPGSTTIRAMFGADTASLTMLAPPDFTGTWTGVRRVTVCVHPAGLLRGVVPGQPHGGDDAGPDPGAGSRHGHAPLSPPLGLTAAAVSGTISDSGT